MSDSSSDSSCDLPSGISPDASGVSRRAFLRHASQAGVALSFGGVAYAPALANAQAQAHAAPRLEDATRGPDGARLATAAFGDVIGGMRWRMLGPFRGGRVAAATGVPGRPNEFYFGSVNGGVWKSVDAGRVWAPVFDAMPVASIGALAVAPSAPDVVYAGSGESTLRDSTGFGNGVYKSVDAGRTWTHLGLDETHHIGRIAVHPREPDTLFVAAIGHLYAANKERGVYRSRDGGRSWQQVLFRNADVGAVDVAIDPSDPRVVYAALWNTRRPPWYTYAPTNGPGGGLWKSTDGGDHWTQLTAGLPNEAVGRIGIAIAPSEPRRLYVVVDCLLPEPGAPVPNAAPAGAAPNGRAAPPPMQGGVFRSDDAGATWRRLSNDPALWGRGWYFEKLVVDPKDPDVVYVSNVSVSRTMDGGRTWVPLRGSPGGDDYHQPWVSPDDPNTMIVASDQGAIITRNAKAADPRAVTWSSWLNQPTAQLYHISVDHRTPYWVTGAQQDSGAVAVRSRGKFAEISMRDWEPIGAGGESGYTAGDPLHPGIIFGGTGQRWNLETNTVVPGTTVQESPEPARADWTQPLVFSRADPRQLYYANQFVFRTTDGAHTWTRISGDLTRPDPGVPRTLDATAAAHVDRNGKRGVVYTIAPSPLLVPMVWVGTDDGLIHVTANAGKTWTDVTPAAVTPWSRITMLEASPYDVDSAYAAVDRHQLQDFDPYIYRTRDRGKTWQLATKGLPRGAYVHTVKADVERQGLLFAGTERGAYVSLDDGESWMPLQGNLPVTSVRDFEVHGDDLVVGTHGRGIWVVDDLAPLRQVDATILAADAHLFRPADAVHVAQGGDNGTPLQKDEPQAENPPAGAILYYTLRTPATTPVTLEILDGAGAVVQAYSSDGPPPATGGRGGGGAGGGAGGGIPNTTALWRVPGEPLGTSPGLHRVVWPATNGAGRGAFDPGGERGPRRLVGAFTVRLTVNGQRYTQPLTVRDVA